MFRRLFCQRTLRDEELKTVLQMYKVDPPDSEATKADDDDDECLYPPPPGSFTVE